MTLQPCPWGAWRSLTATVQPTATVHTSGREAPAVSRPVRAARKTFDITELPPDHARLADRRSVSGNPGTARDWRAMLGVAALFLLPALAGLPGTAQAAPPLPDTNADFDSVCENTNGLADRTVAAADVGGTGFKIGDQVNEYVAFGMQGIFFGVDINIVTAGGAAGRIAWEYSVAGPPGTFAPLTLTTDTAGHFTTSGVRGIRFTPPADWAQNSLIASGACSSTHYYVRARTTTAFPNPDPIADQASGLVYNLGFQVNDQLGAPVSGLVSTDFQVSGGTDNAIYGFRTVGPGTYQLALHAEAADTNYDVVVRPDGYVASTPKATGTLSTSLVSLTGSPFSLAFAYKVTGVSAQGGADLTAVAVATGNGFSTACTEAGGAWYCRVPLADTGVTIRAAKDGYVTSTAASFPADRTLPTDPQGTTPVTGVMYTVAVSLPTEDSVTGVTFSKRFEGGPFNPVSPTATSGATALFAQSPSEANVVFRAAKYGVVADTGAVLTASEGAQTSRSIHLVAALTGLASSPANAAAGETTSYTLDLQTAHDWPANGRLVVTFPSDYAVATPAATILSGADGTLSAGAPGNPLTLQRGGGGTPTGGGTAIRIAISGIRNPQVAGPAGGIGLSLQDGLGVERDTGTAPGATITPGLLTGTSVTVGSQEAGESTAYSFGLTSANPWPADGKLAIVFPPEYAVVDTTATLTGSVPACLVGESLSTLRSDQTLLLTRPGTGSACPTGTTFAVRLETVNNPGLDGTTGPFTIRTRTASSQEIDAASRPGVSIDDTQAPTTFSSPSGTLGSGGWYRSTVSITLLATDTGTGIGSTQYRIGTSGPFTTYPGTAFDVTAEGINTIQFRSSDLANPAPNVEGLNSATVLIDTTAPSATDNLASPDGTWTNAPPTVALTLDDPGLADRSPAFIRYTLAGAAPSCSSGTQYGAPFVVDTEGVTTLRYLACDQAGNAGPVTTRTIKVDQTPPTSSVARSVGQPPATSTASFQLLITSSDGTGSGVASVILEVDPPGPDSWTATSFAGTSGLYTFTPTAEGTYVFRTRATDAVGRVEANPALPDTSVALDTAPPTSLAAPAPGLANPTNAATFLIAITATDSGDAGLSSVALEVDPPGATGWTATAYAGLGGDTFQFTPAHGDGTYAFRTRATDAAGNVEPNPPDPGDFNVVRDTTPPTLAYAASPAANAFGWRNADVTITWTCTDNPGGAGVSSTPDPLVFTASAASQEATRTCTDLAGNTHTVTAGPIHLDKVPPILTVARGPAPNANGWNRADVTLDWTCSDALSLVDTQPADLVLSSEGAGQSATGTCTDRAGNSVALTVTDIQIDKAPPTITWTSSLPAANAAGWNAAPITVTWACTDSLSQPVTDSVQTILSTDGEGLAASGTCTDRAGNNAVDTRTGFRLDQVAPGATDDFASPGTWISTPPTITLTVTETGAAQNAPETVRYTTDASTPDCTTSPTYSTPLTTWPAGVTTLQYRACDAAGNPGPVTTRTIQVDSTAPEASDDYAFHGQWVTQAPTITLAVVETGAAVNGPETLRYTLDGTTPSCATSPTYAEPLGSWSQGTTTLTYRACDAAGNAGPAVPLLIKFDSVPPTTLTSLAGTTGLNGWFTSSVTLTLTASDAQSGVTATRYRLDDGAIQTYGGPFVLDLDGTRNLHYWSVDAAGNAEAANAQPVRVDRVAPSLAAMADRTAEATSPAGAMVSFDLPAATDATSGPGPVACAPASGSLFPLGPTTVTCTVHDAAGHSATTAFQLTVQDTTPPSLTAPTLAPHEATSASGAPVTYGPVSSEDSVDGTQPASCTPSSGSAFPLGTTSVTCTRTDAAGNAALPVQFNVTVHDTTPPTIHVPSSFATSASILSYTASATDAVDGSVVPSCDPASGTALPLGRRAVTCSAADAAGNTGSSAFYVTRAAADATLLAGTLGTNTLLPSAASGAAILVTLPSTSLTAIELTFQAGDPGGIRITPTVLAALPAGVPPAATGTSLGLILDLGLDIPPGQPALSSATIHFDLPRVTVDATCPPATCNVRLLHYNSTTGAWDTLTTNRVLSADTSTHYAFSAIATSFSPFQAVAVTAPTGGGGGGGGGAPVSRPTPIPDDPSHPLSLDHLRRQSPPDPNAAPEESSEGGTLETLAPLELERASRWVGLLALSLLVAAGLAGVARSPLGPMAVRGAVRGARSVTRAGRAMARVVPQATRRVQRLSLSAATWTRQRWSARRRTRRAAHRHAPAPVPRRRPLRRPLEPDPSLVPSWTRSLASASRRAFTATRDPLLRVARETASRAAKLAARTADWSRIAAQSIRAGRRNADAWVRHAATGARTLRTTSRARRQRLAQEWTVRASESLAHAARRRHALRRAARQTLQDAGVAVALPVRRWAYRSLARRLRSPVPSPAPLPREPQPLESESPLTPSAVGPAARGPEPTAPSVPTRSAIDALSTLPLERMRAVQEATRRFAQLIDELTRDPAPTAPPAEDVPGPPDESRPTPEPEATPDPTPADVKEPQQEIARRLQEALDHEMDTVEIRRPDTHNPFPPARTRPDASPGPDEEFVWGDLNAEINLKAHWKPKRPRTIRDAPRTAQDDGES